MKKFLLLMAPLVLGFGVMTGFMAVATTGDRSVSFPLQMGAMVLIFGALVLGIVGWALPSKRRRTERMLENAERE